MKARELMTGDPTCCSPEDTIQQVAQLMRDHDCGCIPVVESEESKRLVGVITDRDIAILSRSAASRWWTSGDPAWA